ncbi:MAG: alpha/beta hydrolase [Pasteurellaceae bacterium]|nr:alpha/beta hydrolase [Pasteurellaceae bacterium]
MHQTAPKLVYLTHGYTANSQSHWFPWLKQQLQARQIECRVFDMPNSCQPNVDEWLTYHQQHIDRCDEDCFFIGHSLGCIATLHYLAQTQRNIGGLLLVSGFCEHLPHLPELDSFTQNPINFEHIIPLTPQRTVVASLNDSIVPPDYSAHLAKQLKAKYVTVQQGGHFLARDRFNRFPLVENLILDMLSI